ncbi:MAG: OsmC family protein [Acidimicrobiia bacterium]|nr:OsmC family protein [Acidimicrobiia bacterium]
MGSTITANLTGGKTTVEIRSGERMWLADEPIDAGGGGLGPDPYSLLLSALASCTCLTIELYCRRKQWNLDSVSARFTHERIHADDCDACEDDAAGYIDTIRSQVFVEGSFDADQSARLQQVARRCPVHKTLAQGVTFTSEQVVVG